MTFPTAFCAADIRVRWLRGVLVAATLSGMLCCQPLWLAARDYPLVPVGAFWPALPSALGLPFLLITLLSLVTAVWFFRPSITFFLAASLYLYGCDQNRGQPWMYLYWVLLLLNLLPERTVLAACRLALSLVYLWAGVQKLNPVFFHAIPAWFVQPAVDWGLPQVVVNALWTGVWLTPLWEIFIGLGLWLPKTRRPAIALAAMLHGAALVFLGPLGHNINLVVWPWNLAMIALLLVLFGGKAGAALTPTFRELSRSVSAMLVVGLFGLLPILSFFGWWDSYFSFSLYSANLAKADVYLTPSFRDRLPARLQTYVHPVENFNPAFQLPLVFEHPRWAAAQLKVPPLPEPRGYTVMFHYLAAFATNNSDCRMIVETRGGEIWLYRPWQDHPVRLKP